MPNEDHVTSTIELSRRLSLGLPVCPLKQYDQFLLSYTPSRELLDSNQKMKSWCDKIRSVCPAVDSSSSQNAGQIQSSYRMRGHRLCAAFQGGVRAANKPK
jgi:hypothetical protein